jgi:N,N'-diacetyllegionaminate synthase
MNIDKPYIIAEIGINHEGKINYISKLIRSAKKSGANAVKFQIFNANSLADKNSKIKKNYYKKNKKETLFQMWKRLELNNKKLSLIFNLCNKVKIDLIFSIFDKESLLRINKNKIKFIKIASSDINDFPLLKEIKKYKKKVIISTGMSNEFEIKKITNFFGKKNIFLLHCVSLYPCPVEKINLKRIDTLRKKFKMQVGFSDHTIGINACLLALSKGINVLEKHFTLNKNLDGPDHKLSADEKDLKLICDYAKNIKVLNGTGKISPTKKEKEIQNLARKSIYAKRDILKNEKFSVNNLEIRRPKGFYEPIKITEIFNKKSSKIIKKGTNINKAHIKH